MAHSRHRQDQAMLAARSCPPAFNGYELGCHLLVATCLLAACHAPILLLWR